MNEAIQLAVASNDLLTGGDHLIPLSLYYTSISRGKIDFIKVQ
jgi:hypothetical protein